jgi:hypothetical protein
MKYKILSLLLIGTTVLNLIGCSTGSIAETDTETSDIVVEQDTESEATVSNGLVYPSACYKLTTSKLDGKLTYSTEITDLNKALIYERNNIEYYILISDFYVYTELITPDGSITYKTSFDEVNEQYDGQFDSLYSYGNYMRELFDVAELTSEDDEYYIYSYEDDIIYVNKETDEVEKIGFSDGVYDFDIQWDGISRLNSYFDDAEEISGLAMATQMYIVIYAMESEDDTRINEITLDSIKEKTDNIKEDDN